MSSLTRIRVAIGIVIAGLLLSGLTAFPLLSEMNLLASIVADEAHDSAGQIGFVGWILTVRDGLAATYQKYPFIAYGTDWLAFAHLMIALFFILPWRDPVRYEGVLKMGVVMCLLVIPLALICGPIRGIPLGWRLIDCSFGVLCLPFLWFALWQIRGMKE